MHAAYDGLPERLRRSLEGRRGVFLAGRNNAKREFRRRLNDDQRSRTLPVTNPVTRTHPETGCKSFFANPQHTIVGEGCNEADSNVLLDDLFAHYFKDELVYSQSWRVGDLVSATIVASRM